MQTQSGLCDRQALVVAFLIVATVNAWVGWRLPALLPDSSIGIPLMLEKRVAALPHKAAVKVLVFGSSHAVADLRPQVLAEAFNMKPGEIFNLGLPAGTSLEGSVLAERYLPLFPSAQVAIVMVDEVFLGRPNEVRLRYLTRLSPKQRWQSLHCISTSEQRVGFLLSWLTPVADFSTPLRTAFGENPGVMMRRLVRDYKIPGSQFQRRDDKDYPWGVPTVDERPEDPVYWGREKYREHAEQLLDFTYGYDGAYDLVRLIRSLKQQQLTVFSIRAPYPDAFQRALASHTIKAAHYENQLALFLEMTQQPLVADLPIPDQSYFNDHDHMNPAGAKLMAAWLVKELPSQLFR